MRKNKVSVSIIALFISIYSIRTSIEANNIANLANEVGQLANIEADRANKIAFEANEIGHNANDVALNANQLAEEANEIAENLYLETIRTNEIISQQISPNLEIVAVDVSSLWEKDLYRLTCNNTIWLENFGGIPETIKDTWIISYEIFGNLHSATRINLEKKESYPYEIIFVENSAISKVTVSISNTDNNLEFPFQIKSHEILSLNYVFTIQFNDRIDEFIEQDNVPQIENAIQLITWNDEVIVSDYINCLPSGLLEVP